MMPDPLTADDRRLLNDIMGEEQPEGFAEKVYAYYRDANRADRTSRAQMYLHLGMACGLLMRQAEKGRTSR